MKKLYIILVLLLFIGSCSSLNKGYSNATRSIYFRVVDMAESGQKVNKDHIESLFGEDDGNLTLDSDTINEKSLKHKYLFSNNNNHEKISIVTESIHNNINEKITGVSYTYKEKEYIGLTTLIEDDTPTYSIDYKTNDISKSKQLSKTFDTKETLFLNVYNELSEGMFLKNSISLMDLEKLINTKPKNTIERLETFGDKEYQITMLHYISGDYNKGNYESITYYYMNNEKKLNKIIYNLYDNTELSLIKTTSVDEDNFNIINSSVGMSANSAKEQLKIFNKISNI